MPEDDLPDLIRRFAAAPGPSDPDEETDAPDHVREPRRRSTSGRGRLGTRSSAARVHAARPPGRSGAAPVFALVAALAAVGGVLLVRSGSSSSAADRLEEAPRGSAPEVVAVGPPPATPVARRATPPDDRVADHRWDSTRAEEGTWEPPPAEGADRIPVIEEPAPPPELVPPPGTPVEAPPRETPRAGTPKAAGPARTDGKVVKAHPDGKPRERYSVDAKGRRAGEYVSYHENGKVHVRARYVAGELSGTRTEYHPNGRIAAKGDYRKGQPHGRHVAIDEKGRLLADRVFLDGQLLYPRSQEQIAAGLAEVERAPVAPPAPLANPTRFAPLAFDAQARGLKRLAAYRFVCMVPPDVELDAGYGEIAQAGTQLLELVGRLEHTPAKPTGCPDDLYELGYKGTSQSNLHWSSNPVPNVAEPVDGWMWDSDPSNIDRVGHRRWCLNPAMKKTAFGLWKNFAAIYAFDGSRAGHEPPAWVAYPAPGWFPASFLRPRAAWHVSLGDGIQVGDGVSVEACPADDRYRKGDPLELDHFRVSTERFGMGPAVIFRPKGALRGGYWVEVKGLRDASGKAYPLSYYVELTSR